MNKDKAKKLFGKSQRLWILVAVMLVLTILQPGAVSYTHLLCYIIRKRKKSTKNL